ncbi:histidinol dehydrogenase, partial [Vibrio sp. Vb2880]
MARILKNGITEEVSASNDAKVRQIVENILADIESKGDSAVRELSEKFDNWSPEQFRLSEEQIQACVDA